MERVELLLAQTHRRIVPIRRTFVREGHGSETRPGPLAKFLTAHDDRGLEAYLLVHAMAAAEPWNCRLPSDAWVSALGLADTATASSARTAVSKIMGRLEKRKLIERVRSKRLFDVILLKEDGSGDPYERSLKGPEDWWLQLPHAYWLEGHYKTLRLPTKIMMLIALSRPDGFPLPYDRAHDWYGGSSDSAEEGLRELRATGLLAVERNWVKAPRSEAGWTEALMYTLQGSFSTAERKKASRIRNLATTVADDEAGDQVAPVRRNPDRQEVQTRPPFSGPGVITAGWANSLSTLGEHAPVLLGFIVCTYVVLIAITAVVGSLHPDEKRRADAQKVLGRLLGIGRSRTRR